MLVCMILSEKQKRATSNSREFCGKKKGMHLVFFFFCFSFGREFLVIFLFMHLFWWAFFFLAFFFCTVSFMSLFFISFYLFIYFS